MELIRGVVKEDYSKYIVYFIEDLSDELKLEICSRLAAVCHGVDQAQSAHKIYSYKETVKELVKRYKSNKDASENRKKWIKEKKIKFRYMRCRVVCKFAPEYYLYLYVIQKVK